MLKYIKNKNIKKGIPPLLFLSTLVLAADCGNSKPSSSKNLKEISKDENPAPSGEGKGGGNAPANQTSGRQSNLNTGSLYTAPTATGKNETASPDPTSVTKEPDASTTGITPTPDLIQAKKITREDEKRSPTTPTHASPPPSSTKQNTSKVVNNNKNNNSAAQSTLRNKKKAKSTMTPLEIALKKQKRMGNYPSSDEENSADDEDDLLPSGEGKGGGNTPANQTSGRQSNLNTGSLDTAHPTSVTQEPAATGAGTPRIMPENLRQDIIKGHPLKKIAPENFPQEKKSGMDNLLRSLSDKIPDNPNKDEDKKSDNNENLDNNAEWED